MMTEQEQKQLVNGLLKHSEGYRRTAQKAHRKPVAKRLTQRDRELMECMRNR